MTAEPQSPPDMESGSNTTCSLYEEARTLMENAFLMFLMPDLRKLALEGNLKGDPDSIQRLATLPCSLSDVYSLYADNFSIISERIQSEERAEMYVSALEARAYAVNEHEKYNEKTGGMEHGELVVFDDKNEEEELVYGIGVNHDQKRIHVAFRGSVTTKDFEQDAKAFLCTLPNPVEDLHDLEVNLSEDIGIHLGFREYLFGEEGATMFKPNAPKEPTPPAAAKKGGRVDESAKEDEEKTLTTRKKRKVDEILETITCLFQEYPDYQLDVSGHSLGGALATLFAFAAAAASDDIVPNKPVTVISTAAPKVGNLDFLRSFEALEALNKLKCLRIANDRDIVTLSPPIGAFGCSHALCCQRRRYRHVGIRLKLTPHGYLFSYPPKARSFWGICLFDTMKIFRHWFLLVFNFLVVVFHKLGISCRGSLRSEHTQLEYMKRFDKHRDVFENMTLANLYETRNARARWKIPMFRGKISGDAVRA